MADKIERESGGRSEWTRKDSDLCESDYDEMIGQINLKSIKISKLKKLKKMNISV